MRLVICAAAVLLTGSVALASPPTLNCNIGPASKIFGGSVWLVYACDDQHSVVVMSAPGSPAMPFYFMFAYNDGGYQLSGEGTGNKAATDAANKELGALKKRDIVGLFDAAARAAK